MIQASDFDSVATAKPAVQLYMKSRGFTWAEQPSSVRSPEGTPTPCRGVIEKDGETREVYALDELSFWIEVHRVIGDWGPAKVPTGWV